MPAWPIKLSDELYTCSLGESELRLLDCTVTLMVPVEVDGTLTENHSLSPAVVMSSPGRADLVVAQE